VSVSISLSVSISVSVCVRACSCACVCVRDGVRVCACRGMHQDEESGKWSFFTLHDLECLREL